MIEHLNIINTKIIGLILFKVETPIHIGAGDIGVRRSFLRVGDSFVIPSSTWKGCFRSISENIAKTMKFNYIELLSIKFYDEKTGDIKYSPLKEGCEDFINLRDKLINIYRGFKSELPGVDKYTIKGLIHELGFLEEEEKLNKIDENTWNRFVEVFLAINCPLGKLYGNRYMAAKIRFLDTLVKGRTSERTIIGINRRSLTVEEDYLSFIETLNERYIKLTFIADNLKPGEGDSKLFTSTLNYIRKLGLNLGGSKSRGLGYLTIDEEKTRFYIIDLMQGNIDDKMYKIVNPFKYTTPTNIEGIFKWLKS
ncbi:MAG: RAMP superfamily CRISPR-associated protein [Candidatus Methanomethylicia archaeon]